MTDTITGAGHGPDAVGPEGYAGFWLDTAHHQTWLKSDAGRQLDFFRQSYNPDGGFYQLEGDGTPLPNAPQELFATTRLIHSFAVAKQFGTRDCDTMIDHGMNYIRERHHDPIHGGYVWALDTSAIVDDRKLAYGHAFVLLAAASAKKAEHPDANALLADIKQVLEDRFWEEQHGLFSDEANRDWTPFSSYRGFNANMHSIEALLTAYEATDDPDFLEKAGRILEFFAFGTAKNNNHRIPEHYCADWAVDSAYSGNPMFRPAGTTPGHSFELARLLLQYWDLAGRKDDRSPVVARALMERALCDAWDADNGGFFYTLKFDGTPDNKSRYWWPVTEAIGVLATFIKLERKPKDEDWYRRTWQFANSHFIDHTKGGWFPEIDEHGHHTNHQFAGKPDIYHSIQAALFPLAPGISRLALS